MTTTQNLHLPQWEADDRIMRTDFNNAMASIDTALAEKANSADLPAAITAASPIVKLKDVTLGAGTQNWSIDVSDIDFSQYFKLIIYPSLYITNGETPKMLCNNTAVNGGYWEDENQQNYAFSFRPKSNGGSETEIELFVNPQEIHFHVRKFMTRGEYSASSSSVSTTVAPNYVLNTLNFVLNSGSFTTQSRIIIYGIRK